MKIYVAGGFLEKDFIKQLMQALRDAGHIITCDWTSNEANLPGVQSDADLAVADAIRFAEMDLQGVADADCVWHVVASYKGSRGAYVETGYALALCKPLIVSGPDWKKSIFHQLADYRFDTHLEALRFLQTDGRALDTGSEIIGAAV